jgi:hypothetical protein
LFCRGVNFWKQLPDMCFYHVSGKDHAYGMAEDRFGDRAAQLQKALSQSLRKSLKAER